MESKTLNLKTFFETNEYVINETGLAVRNVKGRDLNDYHIPFENISSNRYTTTKQIKWIAIISIFLFVIGVKTGYLILFFIAVALFIVFWKTRQKNIYLMTNDNKSIKFLVNGDNHYQVDDFVSDIISSRNEVLFEKYGKPNKLLDYKFQYESLNWLFNINVISKDVFDKQMTELNNIFNPSQNSRPIGFN